MGNYKLLKAAINEVIKANGRQEITGEVLNQVLLSMVNSLGAGYQCMGVATPSTNPGTPDQNVFYFATQAGTYTNFDAIVLQAGISVLIWDGDWASQTWFTVDSTPTNNSQNLIASGAVFNALKLDGGAYDVSAHNSGATFASLQALLNSENLNTLIPTEIRHGGMSIKFVQSSDNKYVLWRLTTPLWSADPNDWVAENEDFRNKVMQEVNEAIEANTPIIVEGNVFNAPDEEDLTSVNQDGTDVLKFKDKAYIPLTYSGMGRVYLRKNIVNGVNTLTKDMFYKGEVGSREPNTNTIFIIQYDFTLGEDITIPANCVLEFDGGSISGEHTITGQNTGISAGLVKIFNTDVTLAGTYNLKDGLNIAWFGAKNGDDITSILKYAINQAINISFDPITGWRGAATICIPSGQYIVNNNLVQGLSSAAVQLNIKGDYLCNTKITFSGSILFDNNNVFGFTTFENIAFIGNQDNTFMKMYGISNEQSIVFNRCQFSRWNTIIDSQGSVMNSEVTFRSCKISECGGEVNPCNLFNINNSQGVNWRFFGTDIESIIGKVFTIIEGGGINIYQGSIILIGTQSTPSSFCHVPSNAPEHGFGESDRPTITTYGVRFELHKYVYLFTKDSVNAYPSLQFNDTGFYQSNIPSGFYTVDVIGTGKLQMKGCTSQFLMRVRTATNTPFTVVTDWNNFNNLITIEDNGLVQIVDTYNCINYRVLANGARGLNKTTPTRLGEFVVPTSTEGAIMYLPANETTASKTFELGAVTSVRYFNQTFGNQGNIPFTMNIYAIKSDNSETLICSFTGLNVNAASFHEKRDIVPIEETKAVKVEVVASASVNYWVLIGRYLMLTCI